MRSQPRAHATAALVGVAALVAATSGASAHADTVSSDPPTTGALPADSAAVSKSAVLGPVLVPFGGSGADAERLRRPLPTDPLAPRAREIESALRDAAQDLGLEVDLTAQWPQDRARDVDLIARAANNTWIISPRLEQRGRDEFILRVVAVAPRSTTILTRVEKTDAAHLSARAVVVLRDLLALKVGNCPTATAGDEAAPLADDERGRSRGRPVLAASTTLFGLYGALSIYRSTGSDDPRLLYPLLALGSGVGLGASLLASEEWDVTPGAAYTLAGGTWWGVFAGFEMATGRDVQPKDDRLAWGLAGGIAGTAVAATSLALTHYDEGDAALTHSGAALGTLAGGAINLLAKGDLAARPSTGLGFGAAAGLVAGGTLAAFVDTSSQRVLLVDLGAGIGALAGASLASPLVFRETTEAKSRLFMSSVLAGTLAGGAIAFLATRGHAPKRGASSLVVQPTAGVLGQSADPRTGSWAPVFGAGVMGVF